MDFLLAAKYRYYGKDDSQNILQKVNREIPQNISACKHELLCIQYRRTSSFELLKKYLEENADEWDEW